MKLCDLRDSVVKKNKLTAEIFFTTETFRKMQRYTGRATATMVRVPNGKYKADNSNHIY